MITQELPAEPTITQACAMLRGQGFDLRFYQIQYAIKAGKIPTPPMRCGCYVFPPEHFAALRTYLIGAGHGPQG